MHQAPLTYSTIMNQNVYVAKDLIASDTTPGKDAPSVRSLAKFEPRFPKDLDIIFTRSNSSVLLAERISRDFFSANA